MHLCNKMVMLLLVLLWTVDLALYLFELVSVYAMHSYVIWFQRGTLLQPTYHNISPYRKCWKRHTFNLWYSLDTSNRFTGIFETKYFYVTISNPHPPPTILKQKWFKNFSHINCLEFFKVTTTVQDVGDVDLNIWHRTRSDVLIVKSQETYKTVVDIYSLFTIVFIILVLSIYYGRQQSLIYFLYIVNPYCNRATINYAAEW